MEGQGKSTISLKLLAVVAEASTLVGCLDAAVAAAVGPGAPATIKALHVIVDPAHLVTSSEEVALQYLREARDGTAFERAAAARKMFDHWQAQRPEGGPPVGWKEVTGAEDEMVTREAWQADLLIVAKPRNLDGHDALHAAIFRSGKLVLLAPTDWNDRSNGLGDHMAIAWNDTPPCRRAVTAALPWIKAARKVSILLIDEKEAVAAELISLLRAEDISPTLKSRARARGSLGDQIIDEAHAAGADALVMGAYRHNEVIEWLLGGTTRHALRHADLPMLLAH